VTNVRVVGYGIVLWLVGFIWGVIVFIVPSFWNIPSVAYVSKLPAVSVVLIPSYALILALVARTELRGKGDKVREGLKFGFSLVVINILLDILVYVVLFRSLDYFSFLSIWFAYALFLAIPALVGRSLRNV
jgi:hypothetical protein